MNPLLFKLPLFIFAHMIKRLFLILFFLKAASLVADVTLGLDRIFEEPYCYELYGKKVALVTNQSALNSNAEEAFDLFLKNQSKFNYQFVSAFAPEHGLDGKAHAFEKIRDTTKENLPIYSLHGSTKRPTDEMLKGVDLIIYDMQSVGVRCYTYETTLTYVMESAAKKKIPIIVLDRPNPRGGVVVEGGSIEEKFKCFFTYNNLPFCHGMTIGELAKYVNEEQSIYSDLKVISMKGWERSMTFQETNLPWAAPSPNMPDSETTLLYPATILIGESLEIVSIDLRGEKPFKRFGAPWIEGRELADALNARGLPGVLFTYESFTPQWGRYQSEVCEGVKLRVTSIDRFKPLLTQYVIIEELMQIHPESFDRELQHALNRGRKKICDYITGSETIMNFLIDKRSLSREIKLLEDHYIKDFLKIREKYLIY